MKFDLSKTRNNLINLSCDIKASEILDFIIPKLNGKSVLITNYNIIFDKIKTITPDKTLQEIQESKYNHIVVFNIYPYDKLNGHIIEILLQMYRHRNNLVLILYLFDFKEIINWGFNAQIIDMTNSPSITVLGYENSKNDFLFEMKLNYKILPFISNKTIIYCVTNKNCRNTAEFVLKEYSTIITPKRVNTSFEDEELVQYLERGIGFINSELSRNDSDAIISLFTKNEIDVLILTHKLYDIKADTIIIKSTKKYSTGGYVEASICEIIDMMRVCTKNSNTYIMTTKNKSNYYKNVLITRKKCVADDLISDINENAKPSFLEKCIAEILLNDLHYSTIDIVKLTKKIKDTFVFHRSIVKKKQIDIATLIEETIDFLEKKRILRSSNWDYNLDLLRMFHLSKLTIHSFIATSELSGTDDSIINQIFAIVELQHLNSNFTKREKKISIIEKIKTDPYTFPHILNILKISLEVKCVLGENLSDVLVLYSRLKSKDNTITLNDVNFYRNTASTLNIGITVENKKLSIKTCTKHEYFVLVEKAKMVLNSLHFCEQINMEIENEDFDLYCICLDDYKGSIILHIDRNTFKLHEKYYKDEGIVKYSKRIKTKSVNCKREKRMIGNTTIELFTPDKITLPSWFIK